MLYFYHKQTGFVLINLSFQFEVVYKTKAILILTLYFSLRETFVGVMGIFTVI